MSNNNYINQNKDRFFKMAEVYDKLVEYLVPNYNFLHEELIKLIPFNIFDKINIIDLGAGSGILLEKILTHFPNAKCYWIDYSNDFLDVSKKRLEKYIDRIQFIISPIEEDWTIKIDQKIHLITSMSAIHHLETIEKKKLYKRCFEILEESGWFFNIDEMKTINYDAYVNSLRRWYKHGEEIKEYIPEKLREYYNPLKEHFDNWKIRNLDNIDLPKSKGDDIHEYFTDQLNWLTEIGFRNVDVFIKCHLWCLVGGQK
ncbi:MAG: class I SAM-dependent methyltransferase [Candidatus Lokiarchaeota archaeon]|nr:class I SAM-dependent methyltransferase [Candidatus Lokiarchaeota archaeon]